MNEIVENYINRRKKELQQAQTEEKNKHLISLGLYKKVYSPKKENSGTADIIDEHTTPEYPELDQNTGKAYKCVAIEVSDEDYQRICELECNPPDRPCGKPSAEEFKNTKATTLFVLGWLIIFIGFAAGFVAGIVSKSARINGSFGISIAVSYWVRALVYGVLLIAFSEIISQLSDIAASMASLKSKMKMNK